MARQTGNQAPTLEMVAAAAGVSRATVSRVVNGAPNVRPEAIAAVNAAIAELKYVPNRAARSLASRATNAIALIVPEDVTVFFGDPFFASVVKGITDRVDDSSYVLNLLVASTDPGHKARSFLESGAVDGAIVTSHHVGDRVVSDHAHMPVVYGGQPAIAADDAYFVDVDNRAAAAAATQHLIDSGRTKLATVTGPTDMQASIDRLTGFEDAVTAVGLRADLVAVGDFTAEAAARAVTQLLDAAGPGAIDGMFVASDLMAVGVLEVLAERGIRVPEDIAIVGFDDSPAARLARVPLTTMAQPSEEQGWRMADKLIRVLSGDTEVARSTILDTKLVLRDSA